MCCEHAYIAIVGLIVVVIATSFILCNRLDEASSYNRGSGSRGVAALEVLTRWREVERGDPLLVVDIRAEKPPAQAAIAEDCCSPERCMRPSHPDRYNSGAPPVVSVI